MCQKIWSHVCSKGFLDHDIIGIPINNIKREVEWRSLSNRGLGSQFLLLCCIRKMLGKSTKLHGKARGLYITSLKLTTFSAKDILQ